MQLIVLNLDAVAHVEDVAEKRIVEQYFELGVHYKKTGGVFAGQTDNFIVDMLPLFF